MADPATIAMAVRAAIAVATDKRTWKVAGVILAAILTPFILLIVMILSLLSGTSQHNNAAVDFCFNGGVAVSSVPAEYMTYIEDMRACFPVLDKAVSEAESGMNGSTLDSIRIKSIFYSLYFGKKNLTLSDADARAFVDCFVSGGAPVSMDTAYANLSATGIPVSGEAKANARQIYERISYGGASAYTGEIEYGGGGGTALEGLSLLHPESKNNLDLVTYAQNAFASGWGYVWGTYGEVLAESLFESKVKQYPDGVGDYEDFIRSHWLGTRTTDCAGLIKSYCWFNARTKTLGYGTNGMPDMSADDMYNAATVKGSIDTMPGIQGLAVWKSGHIGIYTGHDEVIEAMGTKYGVVKTKLSDRGWKAWLEVPHISYATK